MRIKQTFSKKTVSIDFFKNTREMSSAEGFKNINNLPNEVLFHVFEFLSKESLLQCCLVLKK